MLGKWAAETPAGLQAYLEVQDKSRPQEASRKSLSHVNSAGVVSCQLEARGRKLHCMLSMG